MNKSSTALLTTVLLFLVLSTPSNSAPLRSIPETCSCEAADGSCSASVSCHGGCERYCGNNDNCWAECSGFFGVLNSETNIDMSLGTNSQLVSELARIGGKDISFSTNEVNTQKSEVIANLGFKKAPLWNALEFLSERGTVRIGGKDFDSLRRLRKSLLSGERINFGVQNTSVTMFVTDLAGLTGLPYRISSGRPTALINIELRQANLDEIVARVAEQTGTRITYSPNDAGAP